MRKKLAIKGHLTRGKEVIKLLEMLGGKNIHKHDGGADTYSYYLFDHAILSDRLSILEDDDFEIFTLQEFLEKYPFKVGDKVFLYDNITEGCVTGMKWDEDKGTVKYCVHTSAECWCDVKKLLKQEQRNLLLRDLCSRLPYRVKCSFGVDDAIYEITGINPSSCGASEIQATHIKSSINGDFRLNSCKPYLFPLSSLTEEQKQELTNLVEESVFQILHSEDGNPQPQIPMDWYNKNHFDYRGLIPMGLAIEATGKNIYF